MQEDPDMPVFILLAKDELAVDTVDDWLRRAREKGVNAEKIAKVEQHRDALIAFREAHAERMQLPD